MNEICECNPHLSQKWVSNWMPFPMTHIWLLCEMFRRRRRRLN